MGGKKPLFSRSLETMACSFKYFGVARYINLINPFHALFQRQRDPRLNEILFPFYNRSRILQIIQVYEQNSEYVEKGMNKES